MKVFLAFTLLIAGISALPSQPKDHVDLSDERFVTDIIVSVIETVSQTIKDAGLDPLYVKREDFRYALPVPVIFNAAGFVEELFSTGLSNIVVNNINFGVLTQRLNFDIELPLISIALDRAAGEATVFGRLLHANIGGGVVIQRIRVVGEVRVNVGVISGISIRSLSIDLTLGGIISNVSLGIQGNDYSNAFNTFVGGTIPETLTDFRSEINELLEIVLIDIINDFLS